MYRGQRNGQRSRLLVDPSLFFCCREVQKILVDIGDKEPSFIDSQDWIGSMEIFFVLDKLLGVRKYLINLSAKSYVIQLQMKLTGFEISEVQEFFESSTFSDNINVKFVIRAGPMQDFGCAKR